VRSCLTCLSQGVAQDQSLDRMQWSANGKRLLNCSLANRFLLFRAGHDDAGTCIIITGKEQPCRAGWI